MIKTPQPKCARIRNDELVMCCAVRPGNQLPQVLPPQSPLNSRPVQVFLIALDQRKRNIVLPPFLGPEAWKQEGACAGTSSLRATNPRTLAMCGTQPAAHLSDSLSQTKRAATVAPSRLSKPFWGTQKMIFVDSVSHLAYPDLKPKIVSEETAAILHAY